MALRWETLEGWEAAVQARGRTLLEGEHLSLVGVDDGQVVRVGKPSMLEWGGWRYGERLPLLPERRPGFLRRLLGGLPPPPLEGYDPYGLGGPMGGVAGSGGPSHWLGSPFLERAHPLTLLFASVPLAPSCPSCGIPIPLHPWDFHVLTFTDASGTGGVGLRVPCAHCRTEVVISLDEARPTLRLALGVVDPDGESRKVGEAAGEALDRVGGGSPLLAGLGRLGVPLGDLDRLERVALRIALDERAETEALEAEWREAEEIAAIMDGELTLVEGFQAFRERVLGEGRG
jgi:hypothetical protein